MNEGNAGASQVKRKASSKRNASGFPSSYFLRTSPDVVTQFFFPFKDCGKVASRKKLALTEQDILGMKVSNFLYSLRRSRRLKKKIRNGERGKRQSRDILPDSRNARVRGLRVRKARKKKKPGDKSERVLPKQEPVHCGPRYNISFREAREAYGRMRKGRGFYPSNKVIWKNRHTLVLGCSNFYRKGKDDENLKVDNKEYDIVEPPEPSPDPEVPTTGSEFSSDQTGDGPVKRNFHRERKICKNPQKRKDGSLSVDQVENLKNFQMSRSSDGRGGHTQQEETIVSEIDFSKILQNTGHRRKRFPLVSSKSPQVQHTDDRMQRRISGALRNDLVDNSNCTTDSVL